MIPADDNKCVSQFTNLLQLFDQHAYARVNGQWVCIDNIGHDAKPESFPSSADRLQFLKLYPA